MFSVARGSIEPALAASQRATLLRPGFHDAVAQLADLLRQTGRPEAAAEELKRLIADDVNDPQLHWNRGLMLLLAGDYKSGWQEYEWRSKLPTKKLLGSRVPGRPQWRRGFPLDNRSIYLYAEQGLGDTIQFSRFAVLLAKSGARVIFHTQPALVRLFLGQGFFEEVREVGHMPSPFDHHCPLMSLPAALETTIDTIPYGERPYLSALPKDVANWSERLRSLSRPRVGLVWQGALRESRVDLDVTGRTRNIPLQLLAQALDLPGINFVSLQKGDPGEAELGGRESEFWRNAYLLNAAAQLNDFGDTAGLIENLDLVISVDTATAHLAAALGKPTWILNRHDTCWRWLLRREDSPWYPSVRLYRQGADRDWGHVLKRVTNDLVLFRDSFV